MALTSSATRADVSMPPADSPDTSKKALYRVPEAMRLLSLSRSVIYNQIRVGRLHSVKQGKTRLIPADAITAYVSLLKAEAEANQ